MLTCPKPTFTLQVPKLSGVLGSSRRSIETWSFAEVEAGHRIALSGFIEPEKCRKQDYPPSGELLWGFYLGTEYLPHYLTTHVTFRVWCYVNGRGAFSVTLGTNPGGRAYNQVSLHPEDEDGEPLPH
jgi:hypothetical protein